MNGSAVPLTANILLLLRGLDDEFDTDNGYRGHIQFILGIRDPNISDQSGSNGFESDNDADGSVLTPITKPLFTNATLLGPLCFNQYPSCKPSV